VQVIVAQQCDDLVEARRQLGVMVRQFGPPVPGLTHGLTHLFPSAEALAAGNLADLDLPSATIKSVAALAAGIASGDIVLDHGARRADLIASLTAVTGIEPATAHQIALRLGHRSRHGTRLTKGAAASAVRPPAPNIRFRTATGSVNSGDQPAVRRLAQLSDSGRGH
jgi:hypothetical protein